MLKTNKITWAEVMKEFKKGVAFLGSTNEIIPDEKFTAMLGMDFYIDRRYKAGSTTIKLGILDKGGYELGVTYINKKGICTLIEDKFIQIKSDGFTLYYAIV